MKKGENTARLIAEAAEKEFLEKGYAQSKTTDIARAAGVTHAMLHYYFGTKESLFDRVFREKVQALAGAMIPVVEQDIPLEEKIRLIVEAHFDFVAANPRLPFFVIRETTDNPQLGETFRKAFLPTLRNIAQALSQAIEQEAAAGRIAKVHPLDLVLDVVSLNLFPFLSRPVMEMVQREIGLQDDLLARRRAENVEVILRRIRK